MDQFVEVKSKENTTVFIRKDHISAIEEVAGTARSEGYLKLYAGGYSFTVPSLTKEEIFEALINSPKTP